MSMTEKAETENKKELLNKYGLGILSAAIILFILMLFHAIIFQTRVFSDWVEVERIEPFGLDIANINDMAIGFNTFYVSEGKPQKQVMWLDLSKLSSDEDNTEIGHGKDIYVSKQESCPMKASWNPLVVRDCFTRTRLVVGENFIQRLIDLGAEISNEELGKVGLKEH